MIKNIIKKINDSALQEKMLELLDRRNEKLIEKFLISSSYMRFTIEKHPELILTFLEKRKTPYNNYRKYLVAEYKDILISSDYNFLYSGLRDIKSIETAKLCINDYMEKTGVEQTLNYLSDLADFLIENAIRGTLLMPNIHESITCDYIKEKLFIVAMGKHGGMELNVSSDIDLIFFAADDVLEEYELSSRIHTFIKAFLDFVRVPSENGFIYRVDLRLRPDGNDGPIACGVKQSLNYYRNRGRNWEYQAFVKARYIWGSRKLYDVFHSEMERIIYNTGNSENILVDIRNIKDRIERKIHLKTKTVNFKLGAGGIRDIEFIIQFLQMVHGFRYTDIREQNSLRALKKLKTFNILSDDEYTTLSGNYIILRKIENILQFESDLPRQELPESDEKLELIFRVWKIPGFDITGSFSAGFRSNVLKHMKEVRNIFGYIFTETVRYIELKKKILADCSGDSLKIAEDHFMRMDSEYFLRFDEKDILIHLNMIGKLNSSNLCEIDIDDNGDICNINIVAFDYNYEFSKIVGLITANGMDIISGESYTYSEHEDKENSGENFIYRRKRKRIYSSTNGLTTGMLYKRKIVCRIRTKSFNKHITEIDRDTFKNDLNNLLKLLDTNRPKEADNILNTKIFRSFSDSSHFETGVTPIEISVDNEGSDQYTILRIKSKNSFAFLYTFSSVLASRNYYIYKAEISTVNELAHDRLFIMTREGRKITENDKIDELRITVMMIKQYFSFCFNSVNPNNALVYFEDLLVRILESNEKNELPILGQKDVQEKLSTLFGISNFLWEDIFRIHYSALLPVLKEKKLDSARDRKNILADLHKEYMNSRKLRESDFDEFVKILNEFKDREMFRIDLRQILKKTDFFNFAIELTNLAEVIIDTALKKIEHDLLKKYSFKKHPPWAVFGLGKLGGMEMGFASDIELLFIHDSPDSPFIQEYFEKMIQTFLKTIIAKREGIFEIDLNLRPYGKKGDLTISLDSFKKYFSEHGDALFFERQALTKLRFLTSNRNGAYIKDRIEEARDSFVYSDLPPDIQALKKIRKMQIDNYIKDHSLFNAKFSPGGLVEIEYIVQIFQIKYGRLYPDIRLTSTLDVLDALFKNRIIDYKAYTEIRESYIFLRNLINILRMEKGNSKDLTVYPEGTLEFEYLVRRSHFIEITDSGDSSAFIQRLNHHRSVVQNYFAMIE